MRCDLTDAEKLNYGKTSADKTGELAILEADKKQVVEDFKAKIAACEAERASLSAKLSNGYEYRQVTCVAYFDRPERGKKTILRSDTAEEVAVEDMAAHEKQHELTDIVTQAIAKQH